MSSAAGAGRPSASAAVAQRAAASTTRGETASARVRSTVASEPVTAPRGRATRPAAPSIAPPTARPPLDGLTSLYTSLYQLATLRQGSELANDAFTTTKDELERQVEALEREVGQARARRETERQLQLLEEMGNASSEVLEALKMAAEVLGQSSALLELIEAGSRDPRDARDSAYPLQLLLAECLIKLGRLDFPSSSQLSTLVPSLKALLDLRLHLLDATRSKVEQELASQRAASSEAMSQFRVAG